MPACNSMESPTFGSHGYNGCLECLRWSFESQVFWSAPRKSVLGSIPSCSYVCSVSMVVSDNLVYYIMYANMHNKAYERPAISPELLARLVLECFVD